MTLITFLLFLAACVFSFYIPGLVFIDLLKLKLSKGEAFILNWITGICLFLLLSYAFAWINLSYLIFPILIICFLYAVYKKIIISSLSFKSIDYPAVLIILLGSFAFLSITFFSGFMTNDGLQFIKVNSVDGIVHLARIHNQINFFPPTHPGLSGIEFRGYHYFYDFLLSRFVLFFNFSSLDMYFRFFPALISLIYGGSFYLVSSAISKEKIKIRLILFLAYFAQSSGFLLLSFTENYNLIQGSLLIQSIGLIPNPSIVMTIGVLLGAVFLFTKIKTSWKYGLLAGILLGVLSQTKIYTGILGLGTLIVYSFYILARYKKRYILNYLIAIITTGVITAITYFPNNFGVGSLVFAPMLIYNQFMQGHLFSEYHWELRRMTYEDHQNYLRIAQLYAEGFFLFWILNLGIRILPLVYIKKILSKEFWAQDNNIIFMTIVLISIIIPSFFIQSISVFDILQFDWILLSLLSIPTGIVIGNLFNKKNMFLNSFLVLFFGIIIVQNASFIWGYLFPVDKYIITNEELKFYNNISEVVPKRSFIVTLQEEDIPLVAGLTGRSSYYEKELTEYPVGDVYRQREELLSKLRIAIKNCDPKLTVDLMKKTNTKYLITPDYGNSCLSESPLVKTDFAIEKLAFYEFK